MWLKVELFYRQVKFVKNHPIELGGDRDRHYYDRAISIDALLLLFGNHRSRIKKQLVEIRRLELRKKGNYERTEGVLDPKVKGV